MEGDQEIRGFLKLLVYNPVMIVIGEIFKSTQVVQGSGVLVVVVVVNDRETDSISHNRYIIISSTQWKL